VYGQPVAQIFEHSADSAGSPQAVWHRYLDVSSWCDWSHLGVEWSRIDGPFEVGTKGQSKPPGSPALRFRLVAVEPEAFFASEAKLPGGRLLFEHRIEPCDSGVHITHTVTLRSAGVPVRAFHQEEHRAGTHRWRRSPGGHGRR